MSSFQGGQLWEAGVLGHLFQNYSKAPSMLERQTVIPDRCCPIEHCDRAKDLKCQTIFRACADVDLRSPGSCSQIQSPLNCWGNHISEVRRTQSLTTYPSLMRCEWILTHSCPRDLEARALLWVLLCHKGRTREAGFVCFAMLSVLPARIGCRAIPSAQWFFVTRIGRHVPPKEIKHPPQKNDS